MKRCLALLFALALTSCANPKPAAAGKVLSSAELLRQIGGLAYVGDTSYAVVRKEWLPEFYPRFRDQLFRLGVNGWDSAFDCNHFAYNSVAYAQTQYAAESFHDRARAGTLAVGLIWYTTRAGRSHAVVEAITEAGAVYFEPQTGAFVDLTPGEINSTTLRIF